MTAATPGQRAQIACLMEVHAPKPGNVHRFHDFDDCMFLDFAISAAALGPAMDEARETGVGPAVLRAVRDTRRVVATNTNLGMILLLAPLCASRTPRSVSETLQSLTVDDARLVYQAIRLARPGGLGASAEQDVAKEPTVTLLQAMTIAADRDLVARQYASAYHDLFHRALPALQDALDAGKPLEDAIVTAYLTTLAQVPDTLILRKKGPEVAAEASSRAAEALASGDVKSLDRWLRQDGHARNPGATADLIAATLYVALTEDLIRLPFQNPPEPPARPS